MIHRMIPIFVLALLAESGALAFQTNTKAAPTSKAPTYTPAEYNQYMAATQTANVEGRIAALDVFSSKYPHSTLSPFLYQTYCSSYEEAKNYPKVIEYADRFLALKPAPDAAAQLRVLAARTRAFEISYSSTDPDSQQFLQEGRDAGTRAIQLLSEIPKPENISAERFDQEKVTTRAFYEFAVGFADFELRDYKEALPHLQLAAASNDKDPFNSLRLGVSYLRITPPAYLDGFWALARSVALKGANQQKVRAYLKSQLVRYQQSACDQAVDEEVVQLVAQAATQAARPADLEIPSAADLQKLRETAGPLLDELRPDDANSHRLWLAVCGLEFPEVVVKVLSMAKTDDSTVIQAFRAPTAEEMQKGTDPNMEIHILDQPDVERLKPETMIHFRGTLIAVRHDPFLLSWDKAQVNAEDIPPVVVEKPKKRTSRKKHN